MNYQLKRNIVLGVFSVSAIIIIGGSFSIYTIQNVPVINEVVDALHFQTTLILGISIFLSLCLGALISVFLVRYVRKGIQNAVDKNCELINIPTPVMAIDRDFSITFMNKNGADLLGLSQEECNGKKCYDLFKTPHCRTAECRLAQAMLQDQIVTGETIADPDGLNIPIQYSGSPLKDGNGNIIGALEYVVDITDMKKTINDSQEKVGFLNTIPTPVMAIDRDMNVTFINPAGAGAVGKKPEDCIGLKCASLFNTAHCNTPNCQLWKSMQEDGIFTDETIAMLPSGELPIRYTGAPLKDAEGNITGALEYVVDITEIKNTLDDVKEKVEILNNIPTPVMSVDQNMNVRFINPAGAGAAGKTPGECIGLKCASLFNTTHCNTADCQLRKAMREDGVFTNDTVANLPTGILPIRYTGAPLRDAAGNINGALEYVIDITEENMAVNEVEGLVNAALEGKLDARGNPENYNIIGFRNVIKGINDTLNAVIGPLNVAAEYVELISKGEIPEEIIHDYKGDFDIIKRNINLMIQNLTEFAQSVQGSASQVASGSQQMSSSTQQMSESASEQASTVEEISSSVEEMNSSVMQNADNARETSAIAEKAAKDAAEGGKSVSETVIAMQSIAEKIGIVEEIARQTNMLALNAAIEAARAGEHGKGFAVVADEVRNLAARSGDAAREIGDLSQVSVDIAVKAGALIENIVPQIQKTSDLVQEINASSTEQASGIEQVTTSISELDTVIQQNAAATEEIASTSEEFSSQAMQLKKIASFFKVNGNGSGVSDEQRSMHHQDQVENSTFTRIGKDGNGSHKSSNDTIRGVDLNMNAGDAKDKDFKHY